MRRQDREVKDINEIVDILKRSDRTILAFNGKKSPYILPVNTGVEYKDEKIILYFHGAKTGTKYKYIKEDAFVSFESDTDLELVTIMEKGYCTMNYSSVIGYGIIHEIDEYDEKERALEVLCDSFHLDDGFRYNRKAIDRTLVFKIDVAEVRGKAKKWKKYLK